jgi:hypothetical protein
LTKDVGFAAGSPPDMGDQLARRFCASPTAQVRAVWKYPAFARFLQHQPIGQDYGE